MAFTHPHINAFVIVGGDSDFISLVEKLKQYDKKVFVVGGRQFTSGILQRNCHEFIAYENLVNLGGAAAAGEAGRGRRRQSSRGVRVDRTPIEQAIPLVTRALAVLTEREVSPQLGLLKSTLLQLDSTFSERSYGAGSFRDFVDSLAAAGVLRVHQARGGWLVAPAEGETPLPAGDGSDDGEGSKAGAASGSSASGAGTGDESRSSSAPVAVIGTPAEGVQAFRQLLAAAEIRRGPMYLRNVKQIFRKVSPAFDERAYGYANVVDLLRAAQKDGIVRVDRDRQGVVRVFQGASSASPAAPAPTAPPKDVAAEAVAPEEPAAIVEAADVTVEPTDDVVADVPAAVEAEAPAARRGRRARPGGGSRRPRRKAKA
jgi:hypothetical protein